MRVLVADDDVIVQQGLRSMVEGLGHEVVGVADALDTVLTSVDTLLPDVVLLDIRMPPGYGLEGLHAAAVVHERHPTIGTVVLSQFLEPEYAISLLADSRSHVAYLLKGDVRSAELLATAIDTVAAGGTMVDPGVVTRLRAWTDRTGPLGSLSARERELLQLIATGRSNRGISEELALSERTVEAHVASIMRKLGLERDTSTNSRVRACLMYLSGRVHLENPGPSES